MSHKGGILLQKEGAAGQVPLRGPSWCVLAIPRLPCHLPCGLAERQAHLSQGRAVTVEAQAQAAEQWQVPLASFSQLFQVSLNLGMTDGQLPSWTETLEESPGPVHKALLSACPAGLSLSSTEFPLNLVFSSLSLNFQAILLLSLIFY